MSEIGTSICSDFGIVFGRSLYFCFFFKAMAKDPKNHYQETPKQIRQKVLKFINIPEQFAPYARQKGLLDNIQIEVEHTNVETN